MISRVAGCRVPVPGGRVRRVAGWPGAGRVAGWLWRDRPGAAYSRVSTTGPSAVTAIVCSMWAARLPSLLRMVQPSSSIS